MRSASPKPPGRSRATDPPLVVDVRERHEWDEGRLPNAVHIPRGSLESRIERRGARPLDADRRLLRLGHRSAFAAKTLEELGLRPRCQPRRRHHEWKRSGLPVVVSESLSAGPAHPLQPPPPHPGGRRGRTAPSARGANPADRRRRARAPPAALYLAAAGVGTLGIVDDDTVDATNLQRQIVHSTGPARRAQGRVRQAHDRGAEPRRQRACLPGAADVRERRPHPRRGLGRDCRRRRQLPHALSRERRVRLARHPRGSRLDLPLRRPGHRLRAGRRAVLPLPLPAAAAAGARTELRRGRRARRAARNHRLAPGKRGAEARARHRRPAHRPPPARSTRSHRRSPRSRCGKDPECPVCGESPTITEYIDYVEFCQRAGTHA